MKNPMSLENQCVIITGAASGIGRETAILLHDLGANLLFLVVNEGVLRKAA